MDTFRLCNFHGFLPRGRVGGIITDDVDHDGSNELTMKRFSGILAMQLIYKAWNLDVEDWNMFDEDGMSPPGKCKNEGGNDEGYQSGRITTIPSFVSNRKHALNMCFVGDVRNHYGSAFSLHQDVSSVSLSHARSSASDSTKTINGEATGEGLLLECDGNCSDMEINDDFSFTSSKIQ